MKEIMANIYYQLVKKGLKTLDSITDEEIRALVEAKLGE